MYRIYPSNVQGTISVPSSKSHTMRAILFSSLASGISCIQDPLASPDCAAMVEAMRMLGAQIKRDQDTIVVQGFAGKPTCPCDVIQCGNSGQILRFVGAVASLFPFHAVLTGDLSVRTHRPVQPLLQGLNQLGATALSLSSNGNAPILVRGPWTQSKASIYGADSQPVSGLLIAAAFAPHSVSLAVEHPGETPWVALTLDWFRRLGISYKMQNYRSYQMQGNTQLDPFTYRVTGDFSSAAYPIAAALIAGTKLRIRNLDPLDIQGDKIILSILEKMGASFSWEDNELVVEPCEGMKGMCIDINSCIDALPIFAVLGCFAEGKTELVNGLVARYKESDRIAKIVSELKKMGARIEEREDGLVVEKSSLQGAEVQSYGDHRIALSLAVAALGAQNATVIHETECVLKSYPEFVQKFCKLGACIDTKADT